ncbi:hypothetical protein [Paraburkholderia sediminicola]|uniref:hypothetical protein n=1 Tax=Paraburkholderia sediminicola TaxID=458836 RepID=UPI0038BD2B43
MRKEMTALDLFDDSGEARDHWLNRTDAKLVASAIARSESWPRRWIVNAFAAMCGVSRAADRLFCALEDDREDRALSPVALRYLKERVSREVFDRIALIQQIDLEIRERGGLPSNSDAVMTIEPLLIELGAGFRASDAVRRGQRRIAQRANRADLAERQRRALEGK